MCYHRKMQDNNKLKTDPAKFTLTVVNHTDSVMKSNLGYDWA